MPYATVQDLRDRVPETELAQLTDEQGQDVQEATVLQAIRDASAEIDGYLAGRYELPLVSAPEILVGLACDMAFYKLMRLRRAGDVEDARNRYDDAVAYLVRVAKGQVQLGPGQDPGAADPARLLVQTTGAPRLFGRGSLKGF